MIAPPRSTDAGSCGVTVIVPTLNEGPNMASLLARLGTVLPDDALVAIVDDGTDDLPDRVADLSAELRFDVLVVRRSSGSGGLGGAVLEGLRRTEGGRVVVCDGDLQHPPELIPALLDELALADIAVASRYRDGGSAGGLDDGWRRAVSRASTFAARLLFPRRLRHCSDPMSGFFAFRRDAVAVDRLRPRGFKILLEILARSPRLSVAEVPFIFGRREAGASHAGLREGVLFARQLGALRVGAVSSPPPAEPSTTLVVLGGRSPTLVHE